LKRERYELRTGDDKQRSDDYFRDICDSPWVGFHRCDESSDDMWVLNMEEVSGYQLTCLRCLEPTFATDQVGCIVNFLLHLKEKHKEMYEEIAKQMMYFKEW
jgi:hypothetical protein